MTHLTIPNPITARRRAHFHAPVPPPSDHADERNTPRPDETAPEEPAITEPSTVSYEPGETRRRRPTSNYTAGCLFMGGGALAIAALIVLVVLVGLFVSDFEINEEEAASEQGVDLGDDDPTTYELAQPYSGRGFRVQFPADWIALEDEPGENTVIFLSPAALEQTPFDESVAGGLDEDVFNHPPTIRVRHTPLETSARAYIENRVQSPAAEGMNYGEILTRVIGGHPVAWSRAVGLQTPDDAHQVLMAAEVGERLFIFTGYDTPANADELVTLMLEMAQTLALL